MPSPTGHVTCLCLVVLCFQSAVADLRIARWPKNGQTSTTPYGNCQFSRTQNNYNWQRYKCFSQTDHGRLHIPNTTLPRSAWPQNLIGPVNTNYAIKFSGAPLNKWHDMWQEPSTFDYTGLGQFVSPGKPFDNEYDKFQKTQTGQRSTNYDNFLRSNIDNEQDNRDFLREDGHDHLPFRTWNSEVRQYTGFDRSRSPDFPWATVEPGDSRLVPLLWNNPHSAELEINIWIQDHSAGKPIVVPIRRPTCSGEGYGSSVIKFTIPSDFDLLGSKIPGFKGCNLQSEPMCVVQIYAHSVESRTYSSAFPIVIPGHKPGASTASTSGIMAAEKDKWLDMTSLRDFCRPSNDPEADIKNAAPRWARLVSDVYNHAYQNSDFSPYSGQQQESISQNLQASAINKMVTGNRGELGRDLVTTEAGKRLEQLQTLEDTIYKNYEALANKIIRTLGDEMKTTAVFDTCRPGETIKAGVRDGNMRVVNYHCFRCAEVSSMTPRRQTTNTYIPSFQLPQNLIAKARALVPSKYADLITQTGQVRIYVQTLLDLLPFFAVSSPYGIIYQPAMIKATLLTMPDSTKFKKVAYRGTVPAMIAKEKVAKALGCPPSCLMSPWAKDNAKPLVYKSSGTKVTGECSPCKTFFDSFPHQPGFQPGLSTLANIIVKEGLPANYPGVGAYPDPDGSPRVGRPPLPGENKTLSEKALQPDWNSAMTTLAPTPTVAPTTTTSVPTTTSATMLAPTTPTPGPPSETGRRRRNSRRRSSSRRRRRRGSRRRSSRRRRKATSLVHLFEEVAASYMK